MHVIRTRKFILHVTGLLYFLFVQRRSTQGSTTPMWSKISSALKPREGIDNDPDHSDTQSTARHPPPDPFRANATTYYSLQAPPTPPPGSHSRTASREEDLIWSLRTQLALQQELCAQFEIDLGARDELVEALTIRLEASERENDKRKSVVRSWKKKAADLEKMCRHLEEEVDNSRHESMERSIMDAASGEALRQLHRQISQLEREKSDIARERNTLVQAVEKADAEVSGLETERDDSSSEIVQLRAHIQQLQKDSAVMEDAQRQLHRQISQLEREKSDVERERNTLAQAVEKANAEVSNLETERDDSSSEIVRLHAHIQQLQEDSAVMEEAQRQLHRQISQLEREKSDVEGERNTLEMERDDSSSEIVRLRAHIQQLQKDSAVMEVTIVQLNKQLDQDKEDIDGLNIALESKQQELELVRINPSRLRV